MDTPRSEQNALLAALDRDTKLAVARAYRARRQLGESDYPAYVAAREVFRARVPGAADADAGRAVRLIIASAAQMAPKWFWKGVGGGATQSHPP
jgi:hypothetical protein